MINERTTEPTCANRFVQPCPIPLHQPDHCCRKEPAAADKVKDLRPPSAAFEVFAMGKQPVLHHVERVRASDYEADTTKDLSTPYLASEFTLCESGADSSPGRDAVDEGAEEDPT